MVAGGFMIYLITIAKLMILFLYAFKKLIVYK